MKSPSILFALLLCFVGAGTTADHDVIDGGTFARALGEFYPNEDELIRDAQGAAPRSSDQRLALETAILNRWDGPFNMRDFSKWLKENRLNGLMKAQDMGSGTTYVALSHIPEKRFDRLFIGMLTPGPILELNFLIAVDKDVRADDIDPFLQDLPSKAKGDGPTVYDLRPIVYPSSLERLEERK
jgi:hypothetical protein